MERIRAQIRFEHGNFNIVPGPDDSKAALEFGKTLKELQEFSNYLEQHRRRELSDKKLVHLYAYHDKWIKFHKDKVGTWIEGYNIDYYKNILHPVSGHLIAIADFFDFDCKEAFIFEIKSVRRSFFDPEGPESFIGTYVETYIFEDQIEKDSISIKIIESDSRNLKGKLRNSQIRDVWVSIETDSK